MLKIQRLLGSLRGSQLRPLSNWSYVKQGLPEDDAHVFKIFNGIISGQRAALAKGITLVESLNPKKKAMGMFAFSLVNGLMHLCVMELSLKSDVSNAFTTVCNK